MAVALLARAGGPLRRGECASVEPQGRSYGGNADGGSCCGRGPTSGQHLPAARGLCPSSVASCARRAQALQGPRLLLGSLLVGPSSPAPLCAATFTPLPLSQSQARFWVSWSSVSRPGIELRPVTFSVTIRVYWSKCELLLSSELY